MHPFAEEEPVRTTLVMPPSQLEAILVHERTTADIVIELVHRKRRWRFYHLVALSFVAGACLGLATLAVI
jgi:hypothetical protein